MAAPKKTKTLTDMSPSELEAALMTQEADLLGYRRGLKNGELKNPSIIRSTRKEVARLKTALTMNKAMKEGDK